MNAKGFPSLGRSRQGDSFVQIRVVTPSLVDDEAKELFEQLNDILERDISKKNGNKSVFDKIKDAFGNEND